MTTTFNDIRLHQALVDALSTQRDLWKHLTFVAYHESAPRLEIGYLLAETLYGIARQASQEQFISLTHDGFPVCDLIETGGLAGCVPKADALARLAQLIEGLADPVLADLWHRGTWRALDNLLALNLLHIWTPTHDLWHAPGYSDRMKNAAPTVAVLDEDWGLTAVAATAFEGVEPFPSAGYAQVVKMFTFNKGTVLFNPLVVDADAERLAKHLRVYVTVTETEASAAIGEGRDRTAVELLAHHAGDAKSAARCAVVRVAVAFLSSGQPRSFSFL